MKTSKILRSFLVTFLLALLSFCSIFAQQTSSDSIKYTNAMSQVLASMDSLKSVDQLTVVKNSFQRIASHYTEQSMPIYYLALCNINQAYQTPNATLYLQEAEKQLKLLEKMKEVDQSELENLWGYYYMCIISKDPQEYGQKYFQTVIAKFEKAIQLNDQNPRPIILLAVFEQNLPSFLQSKRKGSEEQEKAQKLFDEEEKNINRPYWGKSFLNQIKNK